MELSAFDFRLEGDWNLLIEKKWRIGGMVRDNTGTVREAYNYESFSRSESSGKSSEFKTSLRAGEEAPDFELPSLDGDRVRLAAFRGQKHVLLEFGSIT